METWGKKGERGGGLGEGNFQDVRCKVLPLDRRLSRLGEWRFGRL